MTMTLLPVLERRAETDLVLGALNADFEEIQWLSRTVARAAFVTPWRTAPGDLEGRLHRFFKAEPSLQRLLVAPRTGLWRASGAALAWFDGPLVDVARGVDGAFSVAAYAPCGGGATLLLPSNINGAGISWERATETEGEPGRRTRRCLTAALATYFSASPATMPIYLSARSGSLAEACLMALARGAAPHRPIIVVTPSSPTPGIKRLCQNLTLALQRGEPPQQADVLQTLIPDDLVGALAQALNARSPLLPESLFAAREPDSSQKKAAFAAAETFPRHDAQGGAD